MICVNCTFSLICYAGRLDAEGGHVTLCVRCGELTTMIENTAYRFTCERRPLVPAYVSLCQKQRTSAHRRFPQKTYISHVLIEDPGPGLLDKLHLGLCVGCSNNAVMKRLFGTVIALDELAKAKEESGQHAFEIAGGVSRKT